MEELQSVRLLLIERGLTLGPGRRLWRGVAGLFWVRVPGVHALCGAALRNGCGQHFCAVCLRCFTTSAATHEHVLHAHHRGKSGTGVYFYRS